MEPPREVLLERAKLAEKAERPAVVVEIVSNIAKKYKKLSREEIELFSDGCKNMIGFRVSTLVEQGMTSGNSNMVEELKKCCNNVIDTVEHLLKFASDVEETLLYHKMRGVCYRYMAALEVGPEKNEPSDKSLKAYKFWSLLQIALTLAKDKISPSSETVLGLVINFSIFYHDILDLPDRACHLLRGALEKAQAELDSSKGKELKKSTVFIQQCRDALDHLISASDDDLDETQKARVKIHTSGLYKEDGSGLIATKPPSSPVYRERPETSKSKYKGNIFHKESPRPIFGHEKQTESHQARALPSSTSHDLKDRIRTGIEIIEGKIRDEGNVHALRKLGRGKAYLKDLSLKLQSEEPPENP